MTRSKLGPSIPCAAGSVSSGTSGKYSMNALGQPCVRISGTPFSIPCALVDEVDGNAVDISAEMVEPVQLGLALPPVERGDPVLEKALEEIQIGALLPCGTGRGRRPPRIAQPGPEIRKHPVSDVDGERFDVDRSDCVIHTRHWRPLLDSHLDPTRTCGRTVSGRA